MELVLLSQSGPVKISRLLDMCESRQMDLYAVLGASPSDSVQQLRHRYQQLALQWHPDRLRGRFPPEMELAENKFLEVEAAWRILSDQDTRRQYDLERRVQELTQDGPEDAAVNLEDMIWDQEDCVFTHCCRCGGRFSISEEELGEESGRMQRDDEEEESGRMQRDDEEEESGRMQRDDEEEESGRMQRDDEEEESGRVQWDDEEAGQQRGVLVCCDTCSLSVCVTWSLKRNTQSETSHLR